MANTQCTQTKTNCGKDEKKEEQNFVEELPVASDNAQTLQLLRPLTILGGACLAKER